MTRTALLFALFTATAACGKKEDAPRPTPAAAPAPRAAGSAAVPTAPATADRSGPIPTEEDFEAEASEALSAANLEAELDKLEKEIEAD